MPDKGELQAIIEKMALDNQALVKEFSRDDTTVTGIEKAVDESAITAINRIEQIARTGDTEALQLSASKYLVDLKLRFQALNTSGDGAIKALLERLSKPAPTEDAVKD